jgi:hypothetical protein
MMRRLRCSFATICGNRSQTGGTGICVRDVVPTCPRSLMLREGSKIRAPVGAVAPSAGAHLATSAWVVAVMAPECWRLPKIWVLRVA